MNNFQLFAISLEDMHVVIVCLWPLPRVIDKHIVRVKRKNLRNVVTAGIFTGGCLLSHSQPLLQLFDCFLVLGTEHQQVFHTVMSLGDVSFCSKLATGAFDPSLLAGISPVGHHVRHGRCFGFAQWTDLRLCLTRLTVAILLCKLELLETAFAAELSRIQTVDDEPVGLMGLLVDISAVRTGVLFREPLFDAVLAVEVLTLRTLGNTRTEDFQTDGACKKAIKRLHYRLL